MTVANDDAMRTANIAPDFESWRQQARSLLQAEVSPEGVIWDDGTRTASLFQPSMDLDDGADGGPQIEAGGTPQFDSDDSAFTIPAGFLEPARQAACHRSGQRWDLLYRIVWRLTRGGQRHLLQIESDADVRHFHDLAKAVRRDRHKMTAFVRFRKVGDNAITGREQFVAWFEPEHHIVELTAPFFAKRFAGMDWSILTPGRCVHWDGGQLTFTAGVPRSSAPGEDELDDLWRTYYANIFNPARLKLKAMQSEMPKKYWKNLPEASLIAELTAHAGRRTGVMIDAGPNPGREHVSAKIPAGVPRVHRSGGAGRSSGLADKAMDSPAVVVPVGYLESIEHHSLTDLAAAADCCRACPLHEHATQTVFGEGPENARIMIVGEQPGDREDIAGRPFIGPAGKLLDRALAAAGIERDECYLTNTVKHFKWQPGPRGKQRLHKTASRDEVQICKPWVIAEALKVRPAVLICLGATAARALIDPQFRVSHDRGEVDAPPPIAPRVIATVHPSSLLRMRNERDKAAAYEAFVEDLRLAV